MLIGRMRLRLDELVRINACETKSYWQDELIATEFIVTDTNRFEVMGKITWIGSLMTHC